MPRCLPMLPVMLLLFPFVANAVPLVDIGAMTCPGEQTTSASGDISLYCTGDYSLAGGSIISESAVSITADLSLSLDDLSIMAPYVELISLGGMLSLGAGVNITSSSIVIGVGDFTNQVIDELPGGGAVTLLVGGGIILQGSDPRVLPLVDLDRTLLSDGSLILVSSVPEPNSVWLMILGILGLMGFMAEKRVSNPARNPRHQIFPAIHTGQLTEIKVA